MNRRIQAALALLALLLLAASALGETTSKSAGTSAKLILVRTASTVQVGYTFVSITHASSEACTVRIVGDAFTAGNDSAIFVGTYDWAGGKQIDSVEVIGLDGVVTVEGKN
jgi:hypothetical protein